MKVLFILNDAPYGSERSYNGLRLAGQLAKQEAEVRVFLMGDAAACAKAGQKVPEGFYSIERMLKPIGRKGGEVGVCGTCLDARGIAEDEVMQDAHRGTMAELGEWTEWADKVMVF